MSKKRDYKDEYKKFQSSTKSKKYRAELNKYNRKKGTYGNGDGKDASHKGGKIVGFESQSKNRGRAEKSRLKKEGMKTASDVPFGNFDFDKDGKKSINNLAKKYGLKVKNISKGSNYEPVAVLYGDEKKLMKFLTGKDYGTDKYSAEDMLETTLNENPAVIATAARMAIQNAKGKKVSVNTARQSKYASTDPSAHKKAKSIFQRIKDKFKKKDDKPKKKSTPTTAADFRRRRKESIYESVYKFRGMTKTDMDEFDAQLSRDNVKGTPDFNKMTYTIHRPKKSVYLDYYIKTKYKKFKPKRIREGVRESVNEANNIDKIKDIVKKKQFKRIGGVIIDMQTANAIMKVHKALTGANKKKYEKLSIAKMASIAYKLIKW